MNPFINPKKRSILLPKGCKDLMDVLRRTARLQGDPVQTFIRAVLLRAEDRRATELIIGASLIHDGDCSVTEKIGGTWHHVSDLSSDFRTRVVAELIRMAALPADQFPFEGQVCVQLKRRQLKWGIEIAEPDAGCVLTPTEFPKRYGLLSKHAVKKEIPVVNLPSRVVVKDLAAALGAKLYNVISVLKEMEVFTNVKQKIPFYTAAKVAKRFGRTAKRKV